MLTREDLEKIFENLDDGKREVLQSMFDDFMFEQEQIEALKVELKKIGIPSSKGMADKKRYLSKEYMDMSQRHDSKIKIFLSALGKYDIKETSPLMEMLSSFEN